MIGISELQDVPWYRHDWSGKFISMDGCPTDDLTVDDVEKIIAYGDTDKSSWDGEGAGVVLLKDGRYCAWESNWGPTGSGFCCDAYGGTADIAFAMTLELALTHLSEQSRELLTFYT